MAELSRIETVVFLQSVDLYSYCKAEEVLRIAAICRERMVAAGETIYKPNDLSDVLCCVVRGSVKISGGKGPDVTIGPLHTFGVEEILSGQLRGEQATAESDSLILTIEADDFFDLLANNIEIVKALFRYLMLETSGDH